MVWFSVVLAFGSMVGLWIVARNAIKGWAWCLAMEVPWTIYSFAIKQYGLAILCIFYAVVYARNMYKSIRL